MASDEDIRFSVQGRAGIVTLAKQKTLNAVTDAMLTALSRHLDLWEAEPAVERVIIKAERGRAFSAGGDIRHLYDCGISGDYDFDFFAREYALNARIAAFPKPYIALVDGIAMGGGVGVSFHGSHRIAGERALFAMPEVGIGFFPDVGGSYLLSRLPGHMGLYLGLTGARIGQADMLRYGLATHACRSADLPSLETALCEKSSVDAALEPFICFPEDSKLSELEAIVDKTFGAESVDGILERLDREASSQSAHAAWARETITTLNQKAPLSLKVAYRQIKSGATFDMNDCMRMEYRILRRMLEAPDFYEGIRAAIIDKDNTPVWTPDSLAAVDENNVARHFADLGPQELKLS